MLFSPTTHTTTTTTKKSEIKREKVINQNHKQILLQKFQYIHFKETEICLKLPHSSYKFGQTERGRKKEWSKTLGKERRRWDRDEIETTRSLVRWDRDDEIGSADELWVKNENEIGNNGADDLGGTISAARTRRRDLTDVSGVGWDLGSGFAGIEGSSLSLSLSLSLFARLTRKLF